MGSMGRPFYRVTLKVCPHSVLTSLRDAGLVLRLMGRRGKGFGGWSRRFGGASRQSPKLQGLKDNVAHYATAALRLKPAFWVITKYRINAKRAHGGQVARLVDRINRDFQTGLLGGCYPRLGRCFKRDVHPLAAHGQAARNHVIGRTAPEYAAREDWVSPL